MDWARLVPSPTFIFSAPRSGSTLLRCILDSHSQIHAPHEMHLTFITVHADHHYVRAALTEAGLEEADLEYLLWDRILDCVLRASGKSILVEKTPPNVLSWRRIAECWPMARYIFLMRHPLHIMQSSSRALSARSRTDPVLSTISYVAAMEDAHRTLGGYRLRYEDLTARPGIAISELCRYLAVPCEPGMFEYGRAPHGNLVRNIGDWSEKIKSGHIQPGAPLPDPSEVPDSLRDSCAAWGYL